MTFLGMGGSLVGFLLGATGAVVAFLYWLKPPVRRLVVPSRLLWNRLLREKRKSSLLDRLRWWISLMIALFIGLSVATAIGRPEFSPTGVDTRAITIVIDNSATMSTRMSDGITRWDHAVANARRLVRGRSAAGEFLIVDTSGQAPPTEPGQRPEALDVLASLTVSLGGDPRFPPVPESDAELFFISDGVMVDDVPDEAVLISVFEPADNVGITAFSIDALPSGPLRYQAFLEVTNASLTAKVVAVRLTGSGGPGQRYDVTLQPGESRVRSADLSGFDRGAIRATVISNADAFVADDYAYGFLPVQSPTRVALITPGSVYLESALAAEERLTLEVLTPGQYGSGVVADVYIFDRFAPATAPPGPSLLFMPPDADWLARTTEVLSAPDVTGWNAEHPLLQFVSLVDLRVDRAVRIALPTRSDEPSQGLEGRQARGVDVVVGSRELPLVVALERSERSVRVSFALDDSNFPLQPGFPIFLANTLSWLMSEGVALSSAPGRIEVPVPMAEVVDLEGNPMATWPLPDRTVFAAPEPGLYTAAGASRRLRVAVNLTSRRHSSVNASSFGPEVDSSPIEMPLQGREEGGAPDLWMILLVLATLLVAGEWFTYHRRLTV